MTSLGPVHGLHCNLSSVTSREDASRHYMGLPPWRTMPAMVLPNLRSILVQVPKCASTELRNFFVLGSHMFRRAGVEDGMGQMHDPDFVADLGQTEASRRAKREFFTFAFVCNPVKRLVGAYGTINRRTQSLVPAKLNARPYRGGGVVNFDGGGTSLLSASPTWGQGMASSSMLAPSFSTILRTEEPTRFARFVRDLHAWNLSTLQLWPYATVEVSTQGRQMQEALRAMTAAGQGALTALPHVSGNASYINDKGRTVRETRQAVRSGETRGVHFVENIASGTWGHARSLTDFLTVPDTDGSHRRLDFVGRVETLQEDLLRLLKVWAVPLRNLTKMQHQIFSPQSKRHAANAHEGFASGASLKLREAILTNMTDETLGCIATHFEHDFGCFNYTPPTSRRACDPPTPLDGHARSWAPMPKALMKRPLSAHVNRNNGAG